MCEGVVVMYLKGGAACTRVWRGGPSDLFLMDDAKPLVDGGRCKIRFDCGRASIVSLNIPALKAHAKHFFFLPGFNPKKFTNVKNRVKGETFLFPGEL